MRVEHLRSWSWLKSSGLVLGLVVTAACSSSAPSSETLDSGEAPPPVSAAPNGSAGSDAASTGSEAASDSAAKQAEGENLFPDVDVVNLATGSDYNLTNLTTMDRPVLLWFWAPH